MEHSHIQWTDHTFNPWFGCTEVSSECALCYARVLMAERLKRCAWGRGAERIMTSATNWREPLRWQRAAERDGIRRRAARPVAYQWKPKESTPEERLKRHAPPSRSNLRSDARTPFCQRQPGHAAVATFLFCVLPDEMQAGATSRPVRAE